MARLIEGVRVHRLLPKSRLLVSLSSHGGTPQEKQKLSTNWPSFFASTPKKSTSSRKPKAPPTKPNQQCNGTKKGKKSSWPPLPATCPAPFLLSPTRGLRCSPPRLIFNIPARKARWTDHGSAGFPPVAGIMKIKCGSTKPSPLWPNALVSSSSGVSH